MLAAARSLRLMHRTLSSFRVLIPLSTRHQRRLKFTSKAPRTGTRQVKLHSRFVWEACNPYIDSMLNLLHVRPPQFLDYRVCSPVSGPVFGAVATLELSATVGGQAVAPAEPLAVNSLSAFFEDATGPLFLVRSH